MHPVGKLDRKEHSLAHGGGLVFWPGAESLTLLSLASPLVMVETEGGVTAVAVRARSWPAVRA